MSMEPPFTPGHAQALGPAGHVPVSMNEAEPVGILRQAAWIVEAVLTDPAPDLTHVQGLLRKHLAEHPGRPDIALAEHLMALRSFPALAAESEAHVFEPGEPEQHSPESMSVRIERVLKGRMLVTAFQPIRELSSGNVVGVEAFTRFVSDGSDTTEEWFAAAAEARLGSELELAALESALHSAVHLPADVYVALKLSPASLLDPLLPGLLEQSTVAMDRVVLELTDSLADGQPAALALALAPLRRRGLRLAVDHVGSHFGSIRHIRKIRPDFIKLDRNLVAGIDADPIRHAFVEVMTDFADQVGAELIAEGIETTDELSAITGLGVTTGQGYHLGRPTVRLHDWAAWAGRVREFRPTAGR